jgi:uroporphyrin-III C-methyltransferase / precorrin-2 dehydrogenase / sirohydrochlorin ferrochelatase
MDYLPIFCQLQHKACLLVGGGEIAERKARLLLDAGAALTVNACSFSPQFHEWAALGPGHAGRRRVQRGIAGGKVAGDRRHRSRGSQRVGVSMRQPDTGCSATSWMIPSAPALSCHRLSIARRLWSRCLPAVKRRCWRGCCEKNWEAMLPQHLGKLAQLGGSLRQRVKKHFSDIGARRRFWEKLFAHDRLAQSLANDDQPLADRQIEELFSHQQQQCGEVVLVGAGPGDAGLLTLKGLQQIQQADVVVYDRLVSDEVMTLVRRDAERIFVGKRAGNHCVPQDQINQILLEQAQQGKRVVRLKGGDPFIFGRGG